RLADPQHDHFAAVIHCLLDHLDRTRKVVAEPLSQAVQLENLDFEDAFTLLKVVHTSYRVWGQALRRARNCAAGAGKGTMKYLFAILLLVAMAGVASAQSYRRPIGKQEPVRAAPTPPPHVSQRGDV